MLKPFYAFRFNHQVMITDDGEPTQLSSTTRVVISVSDLNDNAPEFDQKSYNVEIPSNAKIDQKLFQVSSSIKDFSAIQLYQLHKFLTSPEQTSHSRTQEPSFSLFIE